MLSTYSIASCRFDLLSSLGENFFSVTSGTSWRKELVRRLEPAGPPLQETFVLLWSYLEEAGLVQAENLLARLKTHPLRTQRPAWPEGTRVQEWLRERRRVLISLGEGEFDLFAVEWLKSIDHLMKSTGERPHRVAIPGLDGIKLYRVHRRREILAETLVKVGRRATAWVGAQNNAIEAYARFHKVVRADPVQGYQIVTREFGRREQSDLRAQLESDWADGHFRVMLWPLETQLEYQGLDVQNLSKGAGERVNFVHLRNVKNETELLAEIPRMVEVAHKEQASLLILPELAVPPAVEDKIRQLLGNRDEHDYPLLTLFGRCHRQVPEQEVDLNEAILLGPDGTEVLCHRKLVPYTGSNEEDDEEPVYLSEQLERGDRLIVLELPFGNFCVAICMDLFRMKRLLEDSHATLVAVPSLSPKTSAHRSAAVDLMNKNRACTFVTNRWMGPPTLKASSFYQLPVKDEGYKAHIESDEAPSPRPPYLLFKLL